MYDRIVILSPLNLSFGSYSHSEVDAQLDIIV